MEPNRYVLKGKSLARLGVQALAEYGPEARIVSAERVTRGGIGGFMAREHFEAVVEVPSSVPAPTADPSSEKRDLLPPPPRPEADSRRRRRLLEEEKRQGALNESPQEDLDDGFARMMDDLWLASRESPDGPQSAAVLPVTASPPPAPPQDSEAQRSLTVPELLRAPGALIVIACLSDAEADALEALADGPGLNTIGDPLILAEADYRTKPLREARQALREARARAVAMEVPVIATCTLRFPRAGVRSGVESPVIAEADQLWAAVDLRRKTEDTRHWLSVLDQARPIDGLVLTWAEETTSPESGLELGWPVSARMNQC